MARERRRTRHDVLLALFAITQTTHATPDVAFPFNSQVPAIARVGQPYSFQFSQSSFAPDTGNFTYSLSDQPAWLMLNSATRTLSGEPSPLDVGAAEFTLLAADGNGVAQMPCTLVVSKAPPPRIEGSVSEELAVSVNLSSSQPPVATLLPASAFRFEFQRDSFIGIMRRQLYYYATLTDHTPLPSWLMFDSTSLTFSGFTPQLSAFPQSWDVELIVSDVAGFAGASITFTIAIATQQLVFVPEQQYVDVTAGEAMRFTGLQDTLFRNGANLASGDLKAANATVPPWLSFDPTSLVLAGTSPRDVMDQNITVTVEDDMGSWATAVLYLVTDNSTLFRGTVGTLTAHSGQAFDYTFPASLFADADVELMVTLPVAARWLHFDSVTHQLSGKVPTQTGPSSIQATLTARSSAALELQTQTFSIKILAPPSSRVTTATLSSSTTNPTQSGTAGKAGFHSRLNGGVVAAVVLGALVAAMLLAACLIFCWRRKKQQDYVDPDSPSDRMIPRPVLPPDADAIRVTTEMRTDVEKNGQDPSRGLNPAPRIALDLPSNTHGRRLKWGRPFSRVNHASSLGHGEDAVRTDSNIPEIGRQSAALHTPHECFSITTEMARSSRLMELSPTKRRLKRVQEGRPSKQSVGLGIDTGGARWLPRHNSQAARSHQRARSSLGLSTTMDGSSATSFSTRGTSVLSTRPSDFPRSPTRTHHAGSRSISTWGLTETEKHKSIRLVERSDSTADKRSMQEKRQSFIRNRASASFASPLFAHGAKASSTARQNGRRSVGTASATGPQRGNSQLTTFSESSSIEAPVEEPRRLSARVRSAFAPNFPRAITKSSLGADDEHVEDGDSDSFYTTSSPISETDLKAELALPRHQRSWVLPGEASPTPPPVPPKSRQVSSAKRITPSSPRNGTRQKWKERIRERSSSPLSKNINVPTNNRISSVRRSKLNEPMSLVSNDSLNRNKPERPRLIQTAPRRPVSVERIQRLSSLQAEAEDTRPGSEMFEALEGAGLMPPSLLEGKDASQKSNFSGPAFL